MSLYNIVNPTSLVAGQPEDISQVLANFQAIQTILNGGIDDANIRPTAAINPSKLLGYPADPRKFLRGDSQWVDLLPFRKTTAKSVVNSVAETDLLNGEFTVAANAMGANGIVRLFANLDWANASGTTLATPPRFKVKLGAGPTVVIDTGAFAVGNLLNGNFGRTTIPIMVTIQNMGATNVQQITFATAYNLESGSVLAGYALAYVTGTGISGIMPVGTGLWFPFVSNGNGVGAIDTTAAMAVQLTVINPLASASLDVTLRSAFAEIEQ